MRVLLQTTPQVSSPANIQRVWPFPLPNTHRFVPLIPYITDALAAPQPGCRFLGLVACIYLGFIGNVARTVRTYLLVPNPFPISSCHQVSSPFSTGAPPAHFLCAYLLRCLDVNCISCSDVCFVDHESGTKVPILSSLFLVHSPELQDSTISALPFTPSSPIMDSRSPAETLTTNKWHAHEWYVTSSAKGRSTIDSG